MLYWTKTHPDNERLAKHLAKHNNQLFTFLKVPGIDATNYRAEQAMPSRGESQGLGRQPHGRRCSRSIGPDDHAGHLPSATPRQPPLPGRPALRPPCTLAPTPG